MPTKKERMYQRITAHGENLLAIFPNATEKDPVKLCKKLHTIEGQLHRIMELQCERDATREDDMITVKGLKGVFKLLGEAECKQYGLFINGDPRGYTLKLHEGYKLKIHTDWGGYGILAPDLTVE